MALALLGALGTLAGCPAHRVYSEAAPPHEANTTATPHTRPVGVPAAPPKWMAPTRELSVPPPAPRERSAAPTIPPARPMDLPPAEGERLLDGLNPQLRRRALLLYQRLAEVGIGIRFIHGFAPYKKRKRMGPGGMANWHNFGLSFDLNLTTRKSMADAKAHYEVDSTIWATVGEVAKEVGLVWGGHWRSSYDPFHFEWHPGHDSVINAQDLRSFLKVAGPTAKHWQRVWTLFPTDEAAP